jgi:hypothetical protein
MTNVVMDAPLDECVVLSVTGALDAESGRDLLRMAATAAASGMRVVEVDLSQVRTFTPGAVFAITGCRRLGRLLRGRVRIVPGQGAGRELWNRSVLAAP